MHHLLQPSRLSAFAHLRAGLRAQVLVLLAVFSLLVPGWPGGALQTATAGAATHAPASGEESPAGESVERENPAKLRRAATVQAPRAAWSRPVPPRPATVDQAFVARSTVPVGTPTLPGAMPAGWRLQRSQAPPAA